MRPLPAFAKSLSVNLTLGARLRTLNRSAVVVTPAKPFLDWLHRADPSSAGLTLEHLEHESAVYLLPESGSHEELLARLAEVSRAIFEEQLQGWVRVPAVWPKDRDFPTFLRWFECGFHSVVMDVGDEPLVGADM